MRIRGLACFAFVVLIASGSGISQAPLSSPQAQKPGTSSGIASGMQSAPQYDAEKRPITAGGFVEIESLSPLRKLDAHETIEHRELWTLT